MLSTKSPRGSAENPITRPKHPPVDPRTIVLNLWALALCVALAFNLLPLVGPLQTHWNAESVEARVLDGETVEPLAGRHQGRAAKRHGFYEAFQSEPGQVLTVRMDAQGELIPFYYEDAWFWEANELRLVAVIVLGLLILASGWLGLWFHLREGRRRRRVVDEDRRVESSAWRVNASKALGQTLYTLEVDFLGPDGRYYRLESDVFPEDPTGRFDPEKLEIVLDPEVPALSHLAPEHLPAPFRFR